MSPYDHSPQGQQRTPQLEQQLAELDAKVEKQQSMLEQIQRQLEQQQLSIQSAKPSNGWSPGVSPFEAQRIGIGDRRLLAGYDARYHSTAAGATPKDFRVMPNKIILVRHAQSFGNVDSATYSYIPDSQVSLTEKGRQQAREAGIKIRTMLEREGLTNERLFFYTSPYRRSLETYESLSAQFPPDRIMGVQEEVQLREQDFGNFQDMEGKKREKADRMRFGRFYYRFPDGESGADVYDRLTIFEDHLIRDINAGRFRPSTSLVLVSHGLAIRILLMRWFHWRVDQFMAVYNPPNCEPVVLERVPENELPTSGDVAWMHTKALYRLSSSSLAALPGCTADMCTSDHMPRPLAGNLQPAVSPPESPRQVDAQVHHHLQQQLCRSLPEQPPRQFQEPVPEWEQACPIPLSPRPEQEKRQPPQQPRQDEQYPPRQFQEPL